MNVTIAYINESGDIERKVITCTNLIKLCAEVAKSLSLHAAKGDSLAYIRSRQL